MKEVPLVLLGFGNVGQALARLLEQRDGFAAQGVNLRLGAVIDRGGMAMGESITAHDLIAAKQKSGTVAGAGSGRTGVSATEALGEALSMPGAILVDASPTCPDTGAPGLPLVLRALGLGRSAVLASKGPLVAAYRQIFDLAREHGCRVGLSAAVGVPLPSVETALLGLHGSTINAFRGLFNETSNRILRDMESGATFEQAVEGARKAGVLEADPRLDLEGWDTAFKILILARTIWNPDVGLGAVRLEGIASLSPAEVQAKRAEGKRLRLLGAAVRSEEGSIEMEVKPVGLEPDDPLYALGPGEKGAVFESDLMGRFVIRSGKAGPFATAACLVKDILNIVLHPETLAV